jgi:shikimate dehydrogenase
MKTKKYAIIGKPVTHSLSPILHGYWYKKYGVDAEYSLLEIEENEIKEVVEKIRKKEISGINITLPYKQKIIPFVDKLSVEATESNSINTVYLNSKNEVVGDNTDIFGFQAGYLKEVVDPSNKNQKTLVLGAGGVAPSIIVALLKSNLKNISLANRTQNKAILLKKSFDNLNIMNWDNIQNQVSDFDIIINATSLGLKGREDFSFDLNNFKKKMVYIDTIYNPSETKMIKFLKLNNIQTFNGLGMFMHQGQKSFYLWNKINPEINDELISSLVKNIK